VMTCAEAVRSERAARLERAGARVVAQDERGVSHTLQSLLAHGIQSLVLEGGAALHAAAWDAAVIDYVQMYSAPLSLGERGVPMLPGRGFSPAALMESKTTVLGPDVLVEGYVHGPR
jgi:diaminohydroxyphosphoribosylaminopyrimidine deaminase / 5-amino-6-(5-phosphoribosylamino)uracil reductase